VTRAARFTVVASLSLLLGCSGDPESPEAQVRATLAEAEAAAEDRDVGFFEELLAEDYSDHRGRNRQEIINSTKFYFVRHQSIHVLSRIDSIEFPIPELAKVELVAGLAGRGKESSALDLEADAYRFELELRQDDAGDWRLIGASWRRGVQK
jgi:hypothetical protein